MITGVTIRNFRGFRDVSVDGFSRVNIVVGDNGSGKTSLLEAVYLAMSNSAHSALSLRNLRMASILPPTGPMVGYQSIADLIGEAGSTVHLSARGDASVTRILTIEKDPNRSSPQLGSSSSISEGVMPASNLLLPALVFVWTNGLGAQQQSIVYPALTQGMSSYVQGPVDSGSLGVVVTRFLASSYSAQSGLANIFSDLDKAGDVEPFLEAMRAQFPTLSTISVQLEGLQALLHARFKGQKQQRPLEYLSGGLARLSAILLSISAPDTSIVIIDEIENGLHHSRFQSLWRQVRDFANRFGKQVFATTHSLECLDAAADAMAENAQDFTLARTARTEAGCIARIVSGEPVRSLLASGLEVR